MDESPLESALQIPFNGLPLMTQLDSVFFEAGELIHDLLDPSKPDPTPSHPNYESIFKYTVMSFQDLPEMEAQVVSIYESCRLAAMIVATAVVHHLPMPDAAVKAGIDSNTPSILDQLGEAIKKTDYYGVVPVWGRLRTRFFLVAMIALAASYNDLEQTEDPSAPRRRVELAMPAAVCAWIKLSRWRHEMQSTMHAIMGVQAKTAALRSRQADTGGIWNAHFRLMQKMGPHCYRGQAIEC